MELRAEVKLRNSENGTETILCTNVSVDQALRWIDFSMKSMDFNKMPEYIIRPIIAKTVPVRREPQNGNVATTKQV